MDPEACARPLQTVHDLSLYFLSSVNDCIYEVNVSIFLLKQNIDELMIIIAFIIHILVAQVITIFNVACRWGY